MSQEVGRRNTLEDSRMMAFFDALVQRDIYGLSEADSGEDSTYTNTVYSTQNSSSDHSDDDGNCYIITISYLLYVQCYKHFYYYAFFYLFRYYYRN